MSSNPFASQLEEAFGADHGIGIERQGAQYLVTIGGGPIYPVSSGSVADALNEAAEGADRATFLSILGVPDGAPPASDEGDHDGDGQDAGELVDDTDDCDRLHGSGLETTAEPDPDGCAVCGAAGGEACTPECDCGWCREQAAGNDGDGAQAALPEAPGAPLSDEDGSVRTEEPAEPEPPAAQEPEAAAPPDRFAARAAVYETWSFNDLRRELSIRRNAPTPRGTTRPEVIEALVRSDWERERAAAQAAAPAPLPTEPPAADEDDDFAGAELGDTFGQTHPPVEPTPAVAPEPAPAARSNGDPLPAAAATVGQLYRAQTDGLLVKVIAPGVAVYFDSAGQVCPRILDAAELLTPALAGTTLEPPSGHHDARIPPLGTVIAKEHQGKVWRLRVDHQGFTLIRPDGEREKVRSLSAAARTILGGTRVNGIAFWGLDDTPAARAEREAAKAARRRERQGLRLVQAVSDWIDEGHVAPTVREALVALVGKLGGENGT